MIGSGPLVSLVQSTSWMRKSILLFKLSFGATARAFFFGLLELEEVENTIRYILGLFGLNLLLLKLKIEN